MSQMFCTYEGKNIAADCLFRPTCSLAVDPCDLSVISESQKGDGEINTYRSQHKPYEMQGSSYLEWPIDIHSQTIRTWITTEEDVRYISHHLASRTFTESKINKRLVLLARHGEKNKILGQGLSTMPTAQDFQTY